MPSDAKREKALLAVCERRMAGTTGTTGIIAMAEQSERSSQGLPASLKAYQHDLERAAMLHPLSAACLQLWDTLLCEVVDETVSAYAQAHAAGGSPLPPAAQELLEGWTSEQTGTALCRHVRPVLHEPASCVPHVPEAQGTLPRRTCQHSVVPFLPEWLEYRAMPTRTSCTA